MSEPSEWPALSREDLLALVAVLQRQIAALRAGHEALRAEIDQRKRGGKRQATPFAKGTRVPDPKPPGRQPGSGTFRYREAPPPEAITEPPVDVRVLMDACPACGGPRAEARVDWAYTTDVPDLPQPPVTSYRVWVCRCVVCGKRVRGLHPDVAPDHYGATAHRLGARVRAAAHLWHDGIGMPVRKVPAVLTALTGGQLTQGALTQEALRRAAGAVGIAYEQVRAAVPAAPVVHIDDTGWRVGGEPASRMAFETDAAPVYQIRPRHRHEEGQEVMPADDAGVMVTDRGRRDDAREFDGVLQQKWLAQILRSLREAVATKMGRARTFGEQLKALLQKALVRWHAHRHGQGPDCKAAAEALQAEITSHLRDRGLNDGDDQRLLDALGWHHDQGNLRRCLADPRVEPTNHRAERARRPAVIARKVSQGSKNSREAGALTAFTSVLQTLIQTDADAVVDTLAHLWRPPQPQELPASP